MIVMIGSSQWLCSLASTVTEITQGLSGLESLPPGQGMLFDLKFNYSRIDINMNEMLFPLDIIFINSDFIVVGVLHDVNPGEEAYFLASNILGARYFLEVNASEAASVNVGDKVVMENQVEGNIVDTIFQYTAFAMVTVTMIYMIGRALKPSVEPVVKAIKLPKKGESSSNPRPFWLVYVTPGGKWGAWNISPAEPALEMHKADPVRYLKEWALHWYLDAEAQVKRGRFAKYWITEAPSRHKAIKNIQVAIPRLSPGESQNPSLIHPSGAYFTRELEARLGKIKEELYIPQQLKLEQLFEVMEDINHMKRAIQEHKSPLQPPVYLNTELKVSYTHDYITYKDYNRFIDESVAIETHMDLRQWSDALHVLNKLMYNVADAFLVDFSDEERKEVLSIIEAVWGGS